MMVAAPLAIWRGWKIHSGHDAILAYGLGALALALAILHLTGSGRLSASSRSPKRTRPQIKEDQRSHDRKIPR